MVQYLPRSSWSLVERPKSQPTWWCATIFITLGSGVSLLGSIAQKIDYFSFVWKRRTMFVNRQTRTSKIGLFQQTATNPEDVSRWIATVFLETFSKLYCRPLNKKDVFMTNLSFTMMRIEHFFTDCALFQVFAVDRYATPRVFRTCPKPAHTYLHDTNTTFWSFIR